MGKSFRHEIDRLVFDICVDPPCPATHQDDTFYVDGSVKASAGDPVIYQTQSRKGQQKVMWDFNTRPFVTFFYRVNKYCTHSVMRAFMYLDEEVITDAVIGVIDLLRYEGPTPFGGPFSSAMALKVNNVLTDHYRHKIRIGEIVIDESSGDKVIRRMLFGDLREDIDPDLLGIDDPRFNRIDAENLVERLSDVSSYEVQRWLYLYLNGDTSFIPNYILSRLRESTQTLLEHKEMENGIS